MALSTSSYTVDDTRDWNFLESLRASWGRDRWLIFEMNFSRKASSMVHPGQLRGKEIRRLGEGEHLNSTPIGERVYRENRSGPAWRSARGEVLAARRSTQRERETSSTRASRVTKLTHTNIWFLGTHTKAACEGILVSRGGVGGGGGGRGVGGRVWPRFVRTSRTWRCRASPAAALHDYLALISSY